MICMKTQKTPNGQNNVDKVEWSWTNHAPWLRNTLESYSYQNNMVLAQKQSYRLMEQDRRFRNKPLHLWSINLWHTDSMEVSLSELREMVMDREAWRSAIHGVAKSRTWLSDWTELRKMFRRCVKEGLNKINALRVQRRKVCPMVRKGINGQPFC